MIGAIGAGLRRGAELAGIEIPGGEIAQVGDVVTGWELSGSAIGLVALDAIVTGERIEAGDAIVGLPSSGLHSNGYTLARRALAGLPLDEDPGGLGRTLGEVLLEPTEIYVMAMMELLAEPERRRARPRPHHRRRAQQPAPAQPQRRLPARRSPPGAAGLRPDRRARRGR